MSDLTPLAPTVRIIIPRRNWTVGQLDGTVKRLNRLVRSAEVLATEASGMQERHILLEFHYASPAIVELVATPGLLAALLWIVKHPEELGGFTTRFQIGRLDAQSRARIRTYERLVEEEDAELTYADYHPPRVTRPMQGDFVIAAGPWEPADEVRNAIQRDGSLTKDSEPLEIEVLNKDQGNESYREVLTAFDEPLRHPRGGSKPSKNLNRPEK